MTLLIAVIGLLATIYAVLPRERRLELRLRLTIFDTFSAVIAFALILYCEYYALFLSHPIRGVPLAWALDRWPKGLKPADASDLILILWASVTAMNMQRRHLSRRNIDVFRKLLDELYWTEGYEEIFNFLERHQKMLFRLSNSDFPLARLRQKLDPSSWLQTFQMETAWLALEGSPATVSRQTPTTRPSKFISIAKSAAESLQFRLRGTRRFLPDYGKSAEVANTIIHNILLSEQFASQLVCRRPYLGISIIEAWRPIRGERSEFIHTYLWKLMEEPSSIIYTELRNNQNLRSGNRYYLPATNQLLHFFLSDAQVAKENSAYKPIGDYVLMLLDELRQNPLTDPYNRALGYFREHEQWKTPLYAAIRFFDIMVEEALHQNIEWHMWLYYMPPIVEKMARNYRLTDPLSNADSEFPNRYSYLLYEIFSSLGGWVTDAAELPNTQANVVLKWIDSQHENGNIPKSSIKALSECLFYAVTSEELGRRQKKDLSNGVFELFFEIRTRHGFQDYGTVLLHCLRDVGKHRARNLNNEYVDLLRTVYSAEESEYLITHPEEHVDELRDFLNTLNQS